MIEKVNPRQLIAAYIRKYPEKTWQTVAYELGVAYATVSRVAKEYGLSRGKGIKIKLPQDKINELTTECPCSKCTGGEVENE